MFLTEDHVYLLIRLDPRPKPRGGCVTRRRFCHAHKHTHAFILGCVVARSSLWGDAKQAAAALVSYRWKMSALKCLLAKDKRTNFVFLMGTCHAERSFLTGRPSLKNYDSLKGEIQTDRQTDRQTGGYATLPAAPLFMNRLSGCCDTQTLFTCSACAFLLWASFTSDKTTSKPPKTCWKSSKYTRLP